MTSEDIEALRREFGLHRPAPVRFIEWFTGALAGDFGLTLIDRVPIMDVIWHPMLNSLQLGIVITLITAPIALAIGATTGYWRGGRPDAVVSTVSIIGYSIPDFVIGTVLIIFFAVWIPLFPAVITVFSRCVDMAAAGGIPAAGHHGRDRPCGPPQPSAAGRIHRGDE